VVTVQRVAEPREDRVVIRPNRSLSWHQTMVFLGMVAVPMLAVSLALASMGYWLVLPFAGVEFVALYACVYLVAQAARRCEVVSVDDARVTVEKGRDRGRCPARGGPQERTEFPRAWVRIEFTVAAGRRSPRRLWLVASGRRVEVGSFLVDDEKNELAAELNRLIAAAG
jgi:uncharacterized membrane protein